ncbi:aminopeptidase N [Propionibacteriaceae bacterium Y2011]
MPSVKRTEAVDRAARLHVNRTHVVLDLTGGPQTFTSSTTIEFDCHEVGETFCDFRGTILTEATLNGVELPAAAWQDGRIVLSDLVVGANTLIVSGAMAYSSDGEGLHRHDDETAGASYLYAMSFLDAAPRWFACFDQPDLKSPYTLEVTAPADWVVAGNGRAVDVSTDSTDVATGSTGVARGVRTWRIEQSVPLSTYLVTLVAGSYVAQQRDHGGTRLGLLVRADLAEELAAQADDVFDVTAACLDAYEELFGIDYPFGDYWQAFVPDFNAGAMENPGCVLFRDQYVFRGAATRGERAGRACTIAHELAHMWFGDLVTMRWWDDLWLNESFAEYLAHRVCSTATDYHRWVEFGISRKDWGMVADQSASTHPVAGNGSDDAQAALAQFDGISYAKGAAVLRQLVAFTGEDAFFTGLRDYFARYARGNAEFADLLACWAAAGADGVVGWAREWLLTSGVDELVVDPDDDGGWTLHRRPPADSPADRPHVITAVQLGGDGTAIGSAPLRVTGPTTRIDLDRTAGAGLVVPDAGDATWARVVFDDWGRVPTVSTVAEPLTRVTIHNALRDAVRSARLAPDRALDLVLAAMPGETSDEIVQAMTTFAIETLCGPYARPADRAGRRHRTWACLSQMLADAEPGQDRQLLCFRLAVSCCDDVALLRRWLAGDLPHGMTMDRDLRWSMTVRLASLTTDESIIDAALALDPSSSARQHAARARAALASPAAKERAFAVLVAESPLTAYEVYAVAEAFFQPHQWELTASYVPRFLSEIDATKRFRQGWSLARVALNGFPMVDPDPGVVALADTVVADAETHPAVRRSLVDGADQLRRAVASLERFHG